MKEGDAMRRGTTPTIVLTITNDDGTNCDLTSAENHVTFSEVGTDYEITKTDEDITATVSGKATVISVTLTQAETLGFSENHSVRVQVRSKLDEVVTASEIATFNVGEILLDGEI